MYTHGKIPRSELQLWGGIECTINRVGNQYFDQIAKNGHERRSGDVESLAKLGIKAVRYPVLWERYCTSSTDIPDCTYAMRQIGKLSDFDVEAIVGLLHHGSGPSDTSLTDPDFPNRFAEYAYQISKQLPEVQFFTPINEPLTTARFSGLYGHWYPHKRDETSFLKALLNQIEAVRLAMQAICSVNPNAKLVQTENLDQCHSTSRLQYQAEFENHRRWLSIDLLTGRVNGDHPLWSYIEQNCDDGDIVDRLHSYPVTISVLGWNYYLTSERFLDHRVERYPCSAHGGNGHERYADVEAVRVMAAGVQGLDGLLMQAWNRYEVPMAITEVHLGCHRESQLRWIADAWQSAQRLRNLGVDLRAVTIWNLLGSYDWDSLCTLERSHYEPGAFDIRSGHLRPTLVSNLCIALSKSSAFDHPALPPRGWWNLPSRLIFAEPEEDVLHDEECMDANTRSICDIVTHELEHTADAERPPLLITGGDGTLGKAFGEICHQRGLRHCLLSKTQLDISDEASIELAIERYQPWAIINTAGYVRVDDAEHDRDECLRSNTRAAELLANASLKFNIPLLTYSTDLVFDGSKQHPYLERDIPRALSVYGYSKMIAERKVLSIAPRSLVIRSSSFFGPWDNFNFLTTSLRRLEQGYTVYAVTDWVVSPTYVPHLVHTSLDLLIDGTNGVWHLANEGQVTWYQFLCEAASLLGMDIDRIIGRRRSESQYVAQRPAFSALASVNGALLPTISESIELYCSHWSSILDRSRPVAQVIAPRVFS